MPPSDLGEEVERRLAAAAEAWLPAHDRDARALILAFLREVEAAGADAIAELRDGTRRWFGARAAAALPVRRQKQMQAGSDTIALEPLPPARHPTMWPQRPKRRTNELFSSWLWRTAVAAGVPPRRFARDVLGTASDDIDRDVAPATLRRLAQLSGQTFEHLAGGILSETVIVTQETPAGLAEDALLRDGRFLLNAEKSDRLAVLGRRCNIAYAAWRRTRDHISGGAGGSPMPWFESTMAAACTTDVGRVAV